MSSKLTASSAAKVDWSKVLARCNPQSRKNILDLRSRHEELRRLILDSQSTVPKLDFEKYRSKLSTSEYGTMLNELEAKVKDFKPQKINVAAQLEELEIHKQAKMKEAGEFLTKLETEIQALRKQLEALSAAKPIEEMTVDDVYKLHPELKVEIYEDIKNDRWDTATADQSKDALEETKKGSNQHH